MFVFEQSFATFDNEERFTFAKASCYVFDQAAVDFPKEFGCYLAAPLPHG